MYKITWIYIHVFILATGLNVKSILVHVHELLTISDKILLVCFHTFFHNVGMQQGNTCTLRPKMYNMYIIKKSMYLYHIALNFRKAIRAPSCCPACYGSNASWTGRTNEGKDSRDGLPTLHLYVHISYYYHW